MVRGFSNATAAVQMDTLVCHGLMARHEFPVRIKKHSQELGLVAIHGLKVGYMPLIKRYCLPVST